MEALPLTVAAAFLPPMCPSKGNGAMKIFRPPLVVGIFLCYHAVFVNGGLLRPFVNAGLRASSSSSSHGKWTKHVIPFLHMSKYCTPCQTLATPFEVHAVVWVSYALIGRTLVLWHTLFLTNVFYVDGGEQTCVFLSFEQQA